MKVKQLSFEEWSGITKKKFLCRKVPDGYVSLLAIEEVTEPQIWDFRGDRIPVCDRGMTWISHLVPQEHYCLTAMLDAAGEAVLWYADMIAEAAVRADGVPYFSDLYLDLVLYRDGTLVENDRDELEAAFAQGEITQAQRQMAYDTARNLRENRLADVQKLNAETRERYEEMCLWAQYTEK